MWAAFPAIINGKKSWFLQYFIAKSWCRKIFTRKKEIYRTRTITYVRLRKRNSDAFQGLREILFKLENIICYTYFKANELTFVSLSLRRTMSRLCTCWRIDASSPLLVMKNIRPDHIGVLKRSSSSSFVQFSTAM